MNLKYVIRLSYIDVNIRPLQSFNKQNVSVFKTSFKDGTLCSGHIHQTPLTCPPVPRLPLTPVSPKGGVGTGWKHRRYRGRGAKFVVGSQDLPRP